ncbi:MAG: helix-turn-helix transcriptional regulator [Candidatus Caldatribacteriaceae bacterium]
MDKLAKTLEVSHQTVDRYLEMLRDDFSAPIDFDRRRGGYYLREKWFFPFPELTEGEVLSLFLLVNFIKTFENTPLERLLSSLRKKLERLFPAPLKMSPQEIEMVLSPSISVLRPQVEYSEVFQKIFRAILKRILITYKSLSSGERRIRKVEPYHLYNFQGVWYFCGFCLLRQEVRDFALDRVGEVRIIPENFNVLPSFNSQEYFASAFRIFHGDTFRVVIRFDAYEAKWIRERICYSTQEIQELSDGGILFAIEANLMEVKRWVLGYGAHAEIIESQFLREEVKRELQEIQKIYSSDRY